MRIVARGMIPTGYWGHGRMWPRYAQVELEVTPEQYAKIASDQNIVSVVIPDAIEVKGPAVKHKGK